MFLSQISVLWSLSTIRQTVGLLLIFLAIKLLAWGGTYLLIERQMYNAVDARLIERMDEAERALAEERALPPPDDGQVAELTADDWPPGFTTRESEGPGPEMRYLSKYTPQGQVLIGENTERQDELRDILSAGMQLSLFASLIAAILAGLWMARRGQARLSKINVGLAMVAQGRLDTRITLDGNDDLSLLAQRIDATTYRLEQAMTQMQVQASNIAHDLRTPLARLRASVESSLIALVENNRAVKADDLGAALEQIDQLSATFDALLRLARIQSGTGRDAFQPVDLGELIHEVAETYRPVIEEAGQTLVLDCNHTTSCQGDPNLLAQMMGNLLQNALRHGSRGQTITLYVHGLRIILTDQGPGIPVASREKVLQPLYQSEKVRQGPGFGLGLSMVRAIAELHSATLSLSDGPRGQGLSVEIALPGNIDSTN
ncbi:MAG: HAMP domain-containing sensor histidine kinase [Pseudomonadota bacterium]